MPVPTSPPLPREARLFRNNRSQAIRIPVEFELPGDRALIRRDGDRLIIEPIKKPTNIRELLSAWREKEPFKPEDQFPDVEDKPVDPEDVF